MYCSKRGIGKIVLYFFRKDYMEKAFLYLLDKKFRDKIIPLFLEDLSGNVSPIIYARQDSNL
jgi:hypothetical protein